MFHQVVGALGQLNYEHITATDASAAGGTLDVHQGFAIIEVTGTVTKVLPDQGFMLIVHNTGTGTITLNDEDDNTVATIEDNESALCFRIGPSVESGLSGGVADEVWHATIIGQGATTL